VTSLAVSFQFHSTPLLPLDQLRQPARPPIHYLPPPANLMPLPLPADHYQRPADEIKIGLIGDLLIGGFTAHQTGGRFADALQNLRTNGFSLGGLKSLGSASLQAGKISAGLSGAVSAVQNIGAVSKGLITTRDAIGNISADTVGGLLTGTTAGLGAGAATLALSSFGVAGLPLTIGAAAAGALGGLGGAKLYSAIGLRDRVFDAVQTLIR